ncbi:cysteine-rich CWC family protein [Vibrio rumoiensis]|uniref:cysteine-rich CWC family protein n=1 Tax=Vibrio rumoiensis TaxID=76258 RepID=UPI003748FD11
MKTPCIAACKNNAGICSGCHRTMTEILQWRTMNDEDHAQVMETLSGNHSTHTCPECGSNAFCDIAAGKDSCWCFELEEREISEKFEGCLCRRCLENKPTA